MCVRLDDLDLSRCPVTPPFLSGYVSLMIIAQFEGLPASLVGHGGKSYLFPDDGKGLAQASAQPWPSGLTGAGGRRLLLVCRATGRCRWPCRSRRLLGGVDSLRLGLLRGRLAALLGSSCCPSERGACTFYLPGHRGRCEVWELTYVYTQPGKDSST